MSIYQTRTPDGGTVWAYSCPEHHYNVARRTETAAHAAERLHLAVSHNGGTPIQATTEE